MAARSLIDFFQRADCPAALIGKQRVEVRLPYQEVEEAFLELQFAVCAWQRSFPGVRVSVPSKQRFLRVA